MTTSPDTRVPSLPFPVHPRRPGDPEADLTGFELTHRALRSGSRVLADAATEVAGGSPCPPERHRAIVHFATHVLAEIHGHHSKEDDVLWPVIVASAAGTVDLAPLTDDHVALQAVLTRAEDALAAFRADIDAAAALAEVMHEIADELDEHIADEEATVFPIIRVHVSAKDFARCEKKFQKDAKLGHLIFVLPWFVGQCTPDERRALWPKAPLPLRMLLRAVEGRWDRRVAVVRGVG